MYYGIIENNGFVLLDEDKERLLNTLPFFPQYSESDIHSYENEEIEQGYDRNFYLKGFAPARPLAELEEERRRERNALLAETDKYMLPDYPVTEEERNKYCQYRQYLRTFPETDGFPNSEVKCFSQWQTEIV